MKIREISFYREFKCLAGECPSTCCRGWMIPLSEEDRLRFMKEGGLLGLRLCLAASPDEPSVLNKGGLTCPFHKNNGLCELQLKKGHSFIPESCRDYPRFFRNYTFFEERLIDLSCVLGARLFMDNTDRLYFTEYEGSPYSEPCCTNDDTGYFRSLLGARQEILTELRDVSDPDKLSSVLSRTVSYCMDAGRAFLSGDTAFFEKHSLKEYPERLSLFPFDLTLFDRLMDTGITGSLLFYKNPLLNRLCALYKRLRGKTLRTDKGLKELGSLFFTAHPKAPRLLSAYYSYYLLGYFMQSYEDYSFVRNASAGIVHLNMIFLFMVILNAGQEELSRDMTARVIASYNKKAYYNESVLKEMYEIMRQSIYNE